MGNEKKAAIIVYLLKIEVTSDYVLRKLYFALVYPYLTYGVEIWGSGSRTQMTRLEGLVLGCVNMMCEVDTGADVFKQLNLLDPPSIYKYFVLLKTFNYIRHKASEYFSSLYHSANIPHTISTRFKSNQNLIMPAIHTSKYLNSFLHKFY